MSVQLIRAGWLAAILLLAGSASSGATPPEPEVKKSKAHICHERGTAGYEQTLHFTAFTSIDACLKSGGRLPKSATHNKSHFNPSKPAHAGDEGVLYGRLVKVIDGDTLIVKVQGAALHFRLAGIDAPESKQRFGDIALYVLAGLIGEEPCVLVYEEGDMYGRLVAHLWIGDMYVNAEMIKRGMAWFDSESAPNDLLTSDEDAARDGKLGLWGLPLEDRAPPWEWRHELR
jgi:endonuclease YncB( thermonuclease family)